MGTVEGGVHTSSAELQPPPPPPPQLMQNSFFTEVPSANEIVTIPDVGEGGKPPPSYTVKVKVPVKGFRAYPLASPRFEEHDVDVALGGVGGVGLLVPKNVVPRSVVEALTDFSPVAKLV